MITFCSKVFSVDTVYHFHFFVYLPERFSIVLGPRENGIIWIVYQANSVRFGFFSCAPYAIAPH